MTRLGPLDLDGAPVSLTIEGGTIAAVEPASAPATATIMPLAVEAHVHLDKTGTFGRAPAAAPGLFAAIEAMEADKALWTAEDLRARMDAAMAEAHAAGVRALRSHIDWNEPAPPLGWFIAGEVAADWQGEMPLQRASLTPLDLFDDAATASAIAATVARDGGVMGAFVYRHGNEAARIAAVFDAAERHDLRLDFHVDEGLDPQARAFDLIVAETRRRGMGGRVLCGHACALSLRAADDLARAADAAAAAGVALSIQPAANLYLQDAVAGRMPRLRGLAPAQELRAAGVEVVLGTDNVRDPFMPFGIYDPLETLRLAWLAGQMPPRDWLSAVTDAPARALGLAPGRIAAGEPADFIILPARNIATALALPRPARQVWRRGRPVSSPEA